MSWVVEGNWGRGWEFIQSFPTKSEAFVKMGKQMQFAAPEVKFRVRQEK